MTLTYESLRRPWREALQALTLTELPRRMQREKARRASRCRSADAMEQPILQYFPNEYSGYHSLTTENRVAVAVGMSCTNSHLKFNVLVSLIVIGDVINGE
jgi:hypothetical protein